MHSVFCLCTNSILMNCFLKIYSLVRISKVEILIYVQQDATLHSLFYLETAPHVSGGTSAHHLECIQLYLQHPVFVTLLRLSAAIVEEFPLFHDSGR